MKKVLAFVLIFVLISSTSILSFAAPGDSNNGNGKGQAKKDKALINEEKQEKSNIKKQFKTELNDFKRDVIKQKNVINKEKETLETQYEELLAAGDTASAKVLLEKIKVLNLEKDTLQAEMKQIINERHMVVKTLYTEEELSNFENAASLIEQMYEEANAVGAGSISVNNNIIKFEAPPYLKGKDTMIPVRTISEQFGAEVTWDNDTQTVTISKENIKVEFKINSTTVYVEGNPVDMGSYAEITCGRTYVPLRFLAEVFKLDVIEDEENEIIEIIGDIEDDTEEVDEKIIEETLD